MLWEHYWFLENSGSCALQNMYPLYDHDLKVTSRPPYLAMTTPLYRTFLTHKSRPLTRHGHKVHHKNATEPPTHHCAPAILSAPPSLMRRITLSQLHWHCISAAAQQRRIWPCQEAVPGHGRACIDTHIYVPTRHGQHSSLMLATKSAAAPGYAFAPGNRYISPVLPCGTGT